jgi:hypothetical protein
MPIGKVLRGPDKLTLDTLRSRSLTIARNIKRIAEGPGAVSPSMCGIGAHPGAAAITVVFDPERRDRAIRTKMLVSGK